MVGPLPPTGEQHVLQNERVRAEIGSVAAVLRSLSVDGQALTEHTPEHRMPQQGRGIVLAPWPNRVREARWSWGGREQLLDVTDPSYGAASHGLLRNTAYRAVERAEDAVELSAFIPPQHGWPFALATRVRYALDEDGITVTHSVQNLSTGPAVWAVGAHPFLRVGSAPVERLVLTVPAAIRLALDDTLTPVGTDELRDTDADLSEGREVETLDLNHPYGAIDRGPSGELAWLDSADGSRTTLWGDEDFRWLQIYTPRDHPREDAQGLTHGLAVAIEPMTAPPDALNSGVDLIHLSAGGSWSGSWGIRYAPGESA